MLFLFACECSTTNQRSWTLMENNSIRMLILHSNVTHSRAGAVSSPNLLAAHDSIRRTSGPASACWHAAANTILNLSALQLALFAIAIISSYQILQAMHSKLQSTWPIIPLRHDISRIAMRQDITQLFTWKIFWSCSCSPESISSQYFDQIVTFL